MVARDHYFVLGIPQTEMIARVPGSVDGDPFPPCQLYDFRIHHCDARRGSAKPFALVHAYLFPGFNVGSQGRFAFRAPRGSAASLPRGFAFGYGLIQIVFGADGGFGV